jgi:hypothetical protein
MDRERQACTELRDHAVRVLHDGQPAAFELTPSGTIGVLLDALLDPLEVALEVGVANGLLADIACLRRRLWWREQ